MPKISSILFVCLGNICRSPAADGVMRDVCAKRRVCLFIDSAGIGPWHVGDLPDSRMRRCGARHGYTFNHVARQVCSADFDKFDLIVGMDNENMRSLLSKVTTDTQKRKVVCLADYMTNHNEYTTIPDPYYGDERDFELALELIEDGVCGLLNHILLSNERK